MEPKYGDNQLPHTQKMYSNYKIELPMRIISFSDYRAAADPLYQTNKILKLENYLKLQNCLFVYDFLHENLPKCFDDYFQKLDEIYTDDINTINSELGCLFTPFKSTQRYGICSITRKCIDSWNFFTKALNTDLSKFSRFTLKSKINEYFYGENNANNENNNNGNNNINNNNINK